MDLKTLLGENYREDMTAAEVAAALADFDMVDKATLTDYVPKETANKLSSEAAELKRKLREKMTEDEQRAAKEAEERQQLESELQEMRRTASIAGYSKRFLGLGFDESAATKAAEAMADGSQDTVFDLMAKHLQSREKALRAELLRDMTPPPSAPGSQEKTITKEDFQAMSYQQQYEIKHNQPDLYKQIQGG